MTFSEQSSLRGMTFRAFANTVYDMFNGIVPITRYDMSATTGRDLFQKAGFKDAVRPFVRACLLGTGEAVSIEPRWVGVLAVRLIFARDHYLSRSLHCEEDSPRLVSPRQAEEEILDVLDLCWSVQGLDWLVLHRAGLPITVSCQDWKLCESARWASKEYREDETWGIIPGTLTKDAPTWTLKNIAELAANLRRRVLRGGESEPVDSLNYTDAAEAADFDNIRVIADDFFWMMKDASYVHHSYFRSVREAKRLEFAADYLSLMQQERRVTMREAYAILTFLCTIAWARYGKGWLDSKAMANTDSPIADMPLYQSSEKDSKHINFIKEIFELKDLAYLPYFEPVP